VNPILASDVVSRSGRAHLPIGVQCLGPGEKCSLSGDPHAGTMARERVRPIMTSRTPFKLTMRAVRLFVLAVTERPGAAVDMLAVGGGSGGPCANDGIVVCTNPTRVPGSANETAVRTCDSPWPQVPHCAKKPTASPSPAPAASFWPGPAPSAAWTVSSARLGF